MKPATKVSLGILVVLAPFLLTAQAKAESSQPTTYKPVPLTGAFMQIFDAGKPWYWPRNQANNGYAKRLVNYTNLTHKLKSELAMDTLVLQDVQYLSNSAGPSSSLIPSDYEATFGNPLKEILTEAKNTANGAKTMKVYLGLEYNQPLFDALGKNSSVREMLVDQTTHDTNVANAIIKYVDAQNPKLTFDGWYITTEIGNFNWSADPERASQFAKYIHDVAEACHTARDLPIAISPYYNHANVSAKTAAQMVKDAIAGSRVSAVMVQDGVGASGNSHDDVITYFKELKAALPTGFEIDADVELFVSGPPQNVAPTSQVFDQLRWQNELGTKGVFGYDALHYFSQEPNFDATDMFSKERDHRVAKGDYALRNALYGELKKLAPAQTSNARVTK